MYTIQPANQSFLSNLFFRHSFLIIFNHFLSFFIIFSKLITSGLFTTMCIPHIKRDCRLNDFQSLDFQSLKQQPFFIFLFRDFVTQSFRRSPIVSKLPMALLRSLYHNLLFICPYTHEHALSRSFVLLRMTVRSLMAQEK